MPTEESRIEAEDRRRWLWILLGVSLLLALFTVYDQVFLKRSIDYLSGDQLKFHRWIMEGISVDPWQYRILAPYMIEGLIRIFAGLSIQNPHVPAFILLRFAQNILLFFFAGLYFTHLGVRRLNTLLAISILAWGTTFSGYRSHLAFDTWFDVVFFLMAGICIVSKRYRWIIPLMAIAAINRETSVLIPVMLIFATIEIRPEIKLDRQVLLIAGISMLIFVLEYGALRLAFEHTHFMKVKGHRIGLDMLRYNLTYLMTYVMLFATFGIIPAMALTQWKKWPVFLQRIAFAIVPAWVVVHPFLAVISETRLFMVPYSMIFLPAVFLAAQNGIGGRSIPESPDAAGNLKPVPHPSGN